MQNRVIRVEMALVTAQVPCFQVFPSCISNLIGSPTWTPSLFFKLFNKVYIMAQTVESTCNVGDSGSIPVSGRSPGGGHGNQLQCSCLQNPDRQRSLVGCSPWGRKVSNMTEQLSAAHTARLNFSLLP